MQAAARIEGRQKSSDESKAEIEKFRRRVALRMLKENCEIKAICRVTDLTEHKVQETAEESSKTKTL